jgi:hypothetical protein
MKLQKKITVVSKNWKYVTSVGYLNIFCERTEKRYGGLVIIVHFPVRKVFVDQLYTETNWATFEYILTSGYIQITQFCNAMSCHSVYMYQRFR